MSDGPRKRPRRIRTPLLQRLSDLRRGPLLFLVWLMAAVAAGHMLAQRAPRGEFVGLAHALDLEVSTTANGLVEEVHVALYQTVEIGTVIARLDSRALEAGLETAGARVAQVQAELLAAVERLQATEQAVGSDREVDLRRFELDRVQLEIDLLRQRLELEAQRVEANRREVYFNRLQDLGDDRLVTEAELDEARLQLAEVRVRIEGGESLRATLERELSAARARLVDFSSLPTAVVDAEPQLEVLREGLRLESLRVAELEVQRRNLVLHAPISGRISQLLARPGQALLAGEPVVRISSAVPESIVMYLPERYLNSVVKGQRLDVARVGRPEVRAESLVTHISPAVERIPERLWLDPVVPEYGLAVVLTATHSLELIPGELLSISAPD